MIAMLIYFGIRDYNQGKENDKTLNIYVVAYEKAEEKAEKYERKYEQQLDKRSDDKEKMNNLKDTISNYLKRLEVKLPK